MLGILLYLPTIAYIPHAFILMSFIYIVIVDYYKNNRISFVINNDIKIIFLIIILFLINRLVFLDKVKGSQDIIPYIIFLPIAYYIAINLTEKTLLILINLILLEALVVILESYLGISTIFTHLAGYEKFNSNALLYFRRPLGLSNNSSDVAIKLFIGILLIEFLKLKNIRYFIYKLIFVFALILTFNRTVLVGLIIFYSIKYIRYLFRPIITYKNFFIKIISLTIILVLFSFIISKFGHIIFMQFTRNDNHIELSGRSLIWHKFFIFIKENFIFGNGSYKLFIKYYKGRMAHAHNSFIELLATNGIIIFILYMWFIFRNINWNNFIFIFSFFIVSMAQYVIFWGISLADIIFLFFLKINYIKSKRRY